MHHPLCSAARGKHLFIMHRVSPTSRSVRWAGKALIVLESTIAAPVRYLRYHNHRWPHVCSLIKASNYQIAQEEAASSRGCCCHRWQPRTWQQPPVTGPPSRENSWQEDGFCYYLLIFPHQATPEVPFLHDCPAIAIVGQVTTKGVCSQPEFSSF